MRANTQIAQDIRARMDAELSDPAKADLDLVAAYADAVLELDGIDPETDEEVRTGIENILHKKTKSRKRRRVRRVLFVAAAVILIAAYSAALMPLGTNDESLLHKWSFFLQQQEPGYRMEFGDYCTLIKGGKVVEYKSIRQFVRKTGADILVPTVLPDKIHFRKVVVTFNYWFDCPSVDYVTGDPKVVIRVYIGYTHDGLDSWERTEQIGGHVCGVAVADDWVQCDFNDGENGYTVSAHSYADMVSIVENLQNGQELYGKG